VVNHGDIAYLCSDVLDLHHNFLTMTPPSPDLHTYFDDELGERVFYSCDEIAYDSGEHLIVIPPKFLSDGVSIPSAAQPLINTPKSPQWIGAGILHDWLYAKVERHENISRRKCDRIFLLFMKLYGVGIIKRRIIYWAVRAAGRLSFRKKTPKFATHNHHD
jgi:hypothetical protein